MIVSQCCGRKHSEKTKQKISEALRGKNNAFFGKHHTAETKAKISKAHLGEKNGMWKGDNVSYAALHDWIRNHKPKPEFCEDCNTAEPYDVATISGDYKRDINDFKWLCRSCHMKMDYKHGHRKPSPTTPMIIKCEYCGATFKRGHGRNKQRFCNKSCAGYARGGWR